MAKLKKHPKAPKAPKANASLAVNERYLERRKEWEKKCSEIDKDNNKAKAVKKKVDAVKNKR